MKKATKLILLACIFCFFWLFFSHKTISKERYGFTVSYLSVPESIAIGEAVEIHLNIDQSMRSEKATYYLRHSQPNDKGELKMKNGTLLLPNSVYELENEDFYLYFTSLSKESPLLVLYIIDNFGDQEKLSFTFVNQTQKASIGAVFSIFFFYGLFMLLFYFFTLKNVPTDKKLWGKEIE